MAEPTPRKHITGRQNLTQHPVQVARGRALYRRPDRVVVTSLRARLHMKPDIGFPPYCFFSNFNMREGAAFVQPLMPRHKYARGQRDGL